MLVTRNKKEVIIPLPASVDIEDLQAVLNFARYKELTSGFKVDQKKGGYTRRKDQCFVVEKKLAAIKPYKVSETL